MPRFFLLKLIFWTAWAGIAFRLCWGGPWFSPEDAAEIPGYWNLLIFWTCMTAAVLLYVIFFAETALNEFQHGEEGPRSSAHVNFMNRRLINLGLMGGFSVALPAFALTFISLAVSIPHFTTALSSESKLFYSIEDSSPKTLPSAFLVAIDISASNLSRSKDTQRLENVCDLVQTLLAADSADPVKTRIITAEDDFFSFVFAGRAEPLFNTDVDFNRARIRNEFCQELKARLSESGSEPLKTDITSFLEDINRWIDVRRHKYSHITVIVLSDFVQDQPQGQTEDQVLAQNSIASFMTKIRQTGCVHLVGVTMSDDGRQRSGVDLRPHFRAYGGGKDTEAPIWREVPLNQYLEKGVNGRWMTLLLNVYREIRHQKPLVLKHPGASSQAIQNWLKMPDDYNYKTIYLNLGSAPESDDAVSNMIIEFPDNAVPFVLDSSGFSAPAFNAYRRQGVPLPVKLKSQIDGSHSVKCDLLIAVPALSTVHSVPLTISPPVGDLAAKALRLALRFLSVAVALFAFAASGSPEVIHRWWTKRRERKHAIPT
jgi:hypothetical protein